MARVHDEIEQDFFGLRRNDYTVTSCTDGRYNCLAWAVGDISQKWDATPGVHGFYWPPGIGRDDRPEEWAEIFTRYHGYEVTTSREYEPGYEKIAIYVLDDIAQHAARQVQNGSWSSKLGDGPDIEHTTLRSLEGEYYGKVAIMLRRRREEWDVS